MSDTTFTNGVTLTDADWFNDVNRLHYTIFGDPTATINAYDALLKRGTNIASAATLDLTTATGDYVHITGSTGPITAITLNDGDQRIVVFDSTPTLTHGASLILPGGANIVAAANDIAVFRGDASSVVRCVSYTPAGQVPYSGTPVLKATVTTKGDLIVATASATTTRQAAGSDGSVLVADTKQTNGIRYVPGLAGHLYGLTLSNNSGDATNDIDIAVGGAIDSTNAYYMTLSGALTKRLDASWAVGTNQGGLDTGSIANTAYHVWLIARSDTGVVDALFSTSATAPTMPSNYDFKRRIGSIIRSGGAILGFVQDFDRFELTTVFNENTNWSTLDTTARSLTCTVPTGIRVLWLGQVFASRSTGTEGIHVYQVGFTDETPDPASNAISGQGFTFNTGAGMTAGRMTSMYQVMTNTSAQVRARSSIGLTSFDIRTRGWIDTRGRLG